MKGLRAQAYNQLQVKGDRNKNLSFANKVLMVTILSSLFVTVLETEIYFTKSAPYLFMLLNYFFIVVFSFEYLVRVWAAGEDSEYRGVVGRLKYIISFWSIIDLISIVPFILTMGSSDTLLFRFFRVLRLVLVFKFGKYSQALTNIFLAFNSRKYELFWSVTLAIFIMFFSATALYLLEGAENSTYFGSIPRALWWGAATISKVGYGGAYPMTILGKFFAIIFALAGVGVVAVPTGIIAGAFYEVFSMHDSKIKKR